MVYGQFLEPDISEVVQEIRFSPFVLYSRHLPNITKFYSQFKMLKPFAVKGSLAPNGFDIKENKELMESLKAHINLFQRIVLLYNKYAPSEKKFTFEKSSTGFNLEWGCCRVVDKFKIGTVSVKSFDDESDINKLILKKITNMEQRLNQLIAQLNVE